MFTYLKTITAEALNDILDQERTGFISQPDPYPHSDYVLPSASRATNDVDLYVARYDSVIPEMGNKKITASGLLAIPVTPDRSSLPTLIYQHGTAFGKYEVPSYAFKNENPTIYDHYNYTYENRYIVGLYAGNGYAVIAADYFGMGDSADTPEAYLVKASAQQASYDLYLQAQDFMKSHDIDASHLFVGGWSLGGLHATGLLERLEYEKIKVNGAFTAASPSDPFLALNGMMYYPRGEIDAIWLNIVLALSVFAFENYHGEKDLAKSVLAPDVYSDLSSVYERSYAGPGALQEILDKYSGRKLIEYFHDHYRDPVYLSQSRYGQLLAQTESYRRLFKTPIRMFYGSCDEIIKEMVGRLAETYQSILIGNEVDVGKSMVRAIRVNGADHRRTFISAAPLAKQWMDQLKQSG